MRSSKQRLEEFLFPADSDTWLGILRIGVGLQVIIYCLSLRTDWTDLFSLERAGLIKRDLSEAMLSAQSHYIPRLGWLVDFASRFGVSEQTLLTLAWWSLLSAAFLLLIGLFSREAAIATVFLHLCAVKSTSGLTYGVDNFTSIGLFYIMIAPLPDRWAVDSWLRNIARKDNHLQGFHRRILQLHLCLIYFFGGITKSAGTGWWDGASIWYALIRPPFNLLSPETLIVWKHLFPILSISVCLLETGYPLFIWLRKTRTLWLVAVITMHLAIGLAMGLYLFALVMITLNVAAFGTEFSFVTTETNATREVVAPRGRFDRAAIDGTGYL
jgi:Vitamin K-dependent gamma-carboxylase